MDTLLNKVKKVEEETSERLEQIEQAGRDSMADLLAAEKEVIDKVKEAASRRGKAIIDERLQAEAREINELKQAEEKSTQLITSQAAANRERVVELALRLFKTDFV